MAGGRGEDNGRWTREMNKRHRCGNLEQRRDNYIPRHIIDYGGGHSGRRIKGRGDHLEGLCLKVIRSICIC